MGSKTIVNGVINQLYIQLRGLTLCRCSLNLNHIIYIQLYRTNIAHGGFDRQQWQMFLDISMNNFVLRLRTETIGFILNKSTQKVTRPLRDPKNMSVRSQRICFLWTCWSYNSSRIHVSCSNHDNVYIYICIITYSTIVNLYTANYQCSSKDNLPEEPYGLTHFSLLKWP